MRALVLAVMAFGTVVIAAIIMFELTTATSYDRYSSEQSGVPPISDRLDQYERAAAKIAHAGVSYENRQQLFTDVEREISDLTQEYRTLQGDMSDEAEQTRRAIEGRLANLGEKLAAARKGTAEDWEEKRRNLVIAYSRALAEAQIAE